VIGLLGGLLLAASPSVEIARVGVGGMLPTGANAIRIDVDTGELPAGPGQLEVDYIGVDGDTLVHHVPVPIVPGSVFSRWVLVSPPKHDTAIIVTLLDEAGQRLATSTPVALDSMGTSLNADTDLIAVVGLDRLGLDALDSPIMKVVLGSPLKSVAVQVDDLPDQALALHGVSSVILNDGTVRSDAIRSALIQWTQGGGHLVLTPPALGPPWGDTDAALLDAVGLQDASTPMRVAVDRLQPLFDEPVIGPDLLVARLPTGPPWRTVLQSTDGLPLAVRRSMGLGHVTVLGVDGARRALSQLRTPKGRSIQLGLATTWGPLLSRRDLPNTLALAIAQSGMLLRTQGGPVPAAIEASTPHVWLHRTTSVSGRLLLAAGFACVYLLVAGPLTWHFLLRRNKTVLVWPALAVEAFVFSVAAWLLGVLVTPSAIHVQHLSVLDQVAGEPLQRAQSWIDVQLPGTGNRLIHIDDGTAMVYPWQAANTTAIQFGDVRRLEPTTRPDQVIVAARDANTRIKVDWQGEGSTDPWARLLSAAPDDPIYVDADGLHGTLVNRLPVPIHQVSLLWIQPSREKNAAGGAWIDPVNAGHPLVKGQWWRARTLDPGATLDLSTIEVDPRADLLLSMHAAQQALGQPRLRLGLDRGTTQRKLELASLWGLATSPPWAMLAPTDPNESAAAKRARAKAPPWWLPTRQFGRTLNLGPWLSGPSLIVMGWVEPDDLPFDLRIDGESPDAVEGSMLIRWIMPLSGEADIVMDDS
jgi:hypothetical protein